ncbi:MAG: MarR family transcriptional regulator [Chloroflexota bacterium]
MDSNHNPIQDAAAVFAAIAEARDHAASPIIMETGLPVSQIRVLYKLHYERDVNMGQLAQHLDIGLPTTSYHVDRMVEAGLVERRESKTDRRSKVISLTPKGQAMINRFLQRPQDQMVSWLVQDGARRCGDAPTRSQCTG